MVDQIGLIRDELLPILGYPQIHLDIFISDFHELLRGSFALADQSSPHLPGR